MSRLGAWHRFGIVLTVVWAIGGGFHALHRSDQRTESAMRLAYLACTQAQASRGQGFEPCRDVLDKTWAVWSEGRWGDAAMMAFLPPALAWALAYAVVGTWQWVRAGKRA